jgi:hypothetical protein
VPSEPGAEHLHHLATGHQATCTGNGGMPLNPTDA